MDGVGFLMRMCRRFLVDANSAVQYALYASVLHCHRFLDLCSRLCNNLQYFLFTGCNNCTNNLITRLCHNRSK